jgi:hypothetical protein
VHKPFQFSTIGQLASIGHRTGVAQILGMRFSGFVAWWLWRGIYLSKLPEHSKKVRVAIKWSFDLLFPRQIEQLVTLRDVEGMEKLGATLRAMRGAAESVTRRQAGGRRLSRLADIRKTRDSHGNAGGARPATSSLGMRSTKARKTKGERDLLALDSMTLDHSVLTRLNADPAEHAQTMDDSYRPANLLRYLKKHPELCVQLSPAVRAAADAV